MTHIITKITTATVYPSHALVSREGTTELPQGKTVLDISALPVRLDPNSIRVKGLSHSGTVVEGIDLQRISHAQAPEPDQVLIDKLQELQYKQEHVNEELNFLKERQENNSLLEQKFVEHFARFYSRGTGTLEQFVSLRDHLHEGYLKLLKRRQELEKDYKILEREIEILQQELDSRSITQKPDDYTLFVYLNNPKPEQDKFQLTVDYLVSGAGWSPSYDFRTDTTNPKIMVDYYGMVQQTTGEDWDDIELILSTARPTVVTTIPELHPWYLDVHVPYRPPPAPRTGGLSRGRAKMAKSKMDDLAAFAMEEKEEAPPEPAPEPAVQVTAAIEDTGETQVYTVPKKESIPSERKPHQVLISQVTNPLEIDFLAIPSSMSDVIRRGRMTNESNLNFLPGEVRLFDGNEFIGKTQIQHIAPTEKFTFALGTTGKIKITRKISAQDVSKKGMLTKTRQRQFEITIDISNNRTENTPLVIKDRVPTSRHEDIKIKLLDFSLEPKKRTKLNICSWKLTLKPQEKQKIIQKYEIEHPVDITISGL